MNKQVKLSQEDLVLLSAYIDGALQEKEKRQFEFRLQESLELQQALEAHRLLQWNLRHLPKPKLPHNFTLTRAEAQAIKRRKAWIPVFSTASLASFLLLAAMFVLPLFRPAASPAPQTLAMEPSLSAPAAPATDQSLKAQVAPQASALPEAAPTELVPAPLTNNARSGIAASEPVQIFTFGAQATGKGGGGGGDASLAMGGGGGVDANNYPVAQPAGNPGTFGNAPYGIVIPVEPLFGLHPGTVRGQDYDLKAVLAPTPSLPPLILGMNIENAGKIIYSDPALPANIEPMGAAYTAKAAESNLATPETPLSNPEPGIVAETPSTSTQVPASSARTFDLTAILKIAAGVLTLLFAGLALYFKKH